MLCEKSSLRSATLLKKRLWHWCFPVNFTKFLRTTFLQNTFGQLFLNFAVSLKRFYIVIVKMKQEKHFTENLGSKQSGNEIWQIYLILQKKNFY